MDVAEFGLRGCSLPTPWLKRWGNLQDKALSLIFTWVSWCLGLPHWLSSKESACNAEAAGDMGSIPGLGRSCGGGHGNPLQHSCLENPMEPGGLQSITSPRVGHDWSDLAHTHVMAPELKGDQLMLSSWTFSIALIPLCILSLGPSLFLSAFGWSCKAFPSATFHTV